MLSRKVRHSPGQRSTAASRASCRPSRACRCQCGLSAPTTNALPARLQQRQALRLRVQRFDPVVSDPPIVGGGNSNRSRQRKAGAASSSWSRCGRRMHARNCQQAPAKAGQEFPPSATRQGYRRPRLCACSFPLARSLGRQRRRVSPRPLAGGDHSVYGPAPAVVPGVDYSQSSWRAGFVV